MPVRIDFSRSDTATLPAPPRDGNRTDLFQVFMVGSITTALGSFTRCSAAGLPVLIQRWKWTGFVSAFQGGINHRGSGQLYCESIAGLLVLVKNRNNPDLLQPLMTASATTALDSSTVKAFHDIGQGWKPARSCFLFLQGYGVCLSG